MGATATCFDRPFMRPEVYVQNVPAKTIFGRAIGTIGSQFGTRNQSVIKTDVVIVGAGFEVDHQFLSVG